MHAHKLVSVIHCTWVITNSEFNENLLKKTETKSDEQEKQRNTLGDGEQTNN